MPLLAAVLLSHPHRRDSSGALLVNYCCVQPVTLHPPALGWRLKVLPELLSNACSERKTPDRRQETTDGWQGAAIPKQAQKGESLPAASKAIGVTH